MDNLFVTTLTIEELSAIIKNAVRKELLSLDLSSNQTEILLTRKETADKLKISLVTLNDWTRRGLIKSYLIGGRVLYKEHELMEAVKSV